MTINERNLDQPESGGSVRRKAWRAFGNHFRARPWKSHFLAWQLLGMGLGVLMLPDRQLASWLGFAIAGACLGSMLAIMTFPFFENVRFTLVGAVVGLLMAPVANVLVGPLPDNLALVQLGLIIGGLMGASTMIWLAPWRILARAWRTSTKPSRSLES